MSFVAQKPKCDMKLINKHGFQVIVLTLGVLCSLSEAQSRTNYEISFNPGHPVGDYGGTGSPTDFDSIDVYQSLNFQANWTKHKLFWKSRDFDFEARYMRDQTCFTRSPCELPFLDVFVVPFSHNDPGWLKTFEGYFNDKTSHVLDNAVAKLSQYPDMTFVWTEISFLSKWWNSKATSEQKQALKKLIAEGRFEILTGGWVMTDEASPSLFSISNQLIEGHSWLRNNLNYKPKAAWSIDPFGHGSVMPYLLKSSGLEGMMVQRLHYAMKHWLGEHKNGDFMWNQRWDTTGEHSIHCLNAPYDLYPTKHSCGPVPEECMRFNFRNLTSIGQGGEEQLKYMKPVSQDNILDLADRLMGQYRRTASLTRHNAVVTGLGNDFEFDELLEWDQQYENYQKLFRFINRNTQRYNARVRFGTLSQYFEAVRKQGVILPNFRGDYFPYSDVYFPYPPAYWTGYFGTRPFFKKLARETEDELRKAEILFSFTVNYLRQNNIRDDEVALAENFGYLVQARRWLALFMHHDGITGTSPRKTMIDYSQKLFDAIRFSEFIQSACIKLLIKRQNPHQPHDVGKTFVHLADQVPLKLFSEETIKKIVLFNSLGWGKSHLVRALVDTTNVIVTGPSGQQVTAQINPKIGVTDQGEYGIFAGYYEVAFIAYLPPLGFTTYEIRKAPDTRNKYSVPEHMDRNMAIPATVQCRNCPYNVARIHHPFVALNNEHIEIILDSENGLLKRIKRRSEELMSPINVTLGKYDVTFGGGAYLSRPLTDHPVDILEGCRQDNSSQVYVVSGPVIQEVTVLCKQLMVSTYILQEGYTESLVAVYLTNSVKPGLVGGSNNGEYFMRFETDLETVQRSSFNHLEEPVLYTDNGLGVEKRMHVSRLGYEGNFYPVVNYAFIEDIYARKRFSVLIDRAHGFISSRSGHLETIFDRRMPYDDARGMNEGVNDPEDMVSNYVLLLESLPGKVAQGQGSLPTLTSQRLSKILNHQPSAFVYDSKEGTKNPEMSIFSKEFPPDVFLLNLRTAPGKGRGVPGRKALMILQHLGHMPKTIDPGNVTRILGSDLNLHHFSEPCDLTGDKLESYSGNHYEIKTSMLDVGKPFELKSYNVNT